MLFHPSNQNKNKTHRSTRDFELWHNNLINSGYLTIIRGKSELSRVGSRSSCVTMKVKMLSRRPDDVYRETKNDIHKVNRNFDPEVLVTSETVEKTRWDGYNLLIVLISRCTRSRLTASTSEL